MRHRHVDSTDAREVSLQRALTCRQCASCFHAGLNMDEEVRAKRTNRIQGKPTLRVLAGSCWQCSKDAQQRRSSSILLQGPLKKQTSTRDERFTRQGLTHVWQTQGPALIFVLCHLVCQVTTKQRCQYFLSLDLSPSSCIIQDQTHSFSHLFISMVCGASLVAS